MGKVRGVSKGKKRVERRGTTGYLAPWWPVAPSTLLLLLEHVLHCDIWSKGMMPSITPVTVLVKNG